MTRQERFQKGFDDALNHQWNCCQQKSKNCKHSCLYLAGHQSGLAHECLEKRADKTKEKES